MIQTEASTRFVGTASFAGITGAPVLVTEWEPDPLRGAFPGDPAPGHAPLSHLELVERADAFLIAPASANTIAKLAGGHADNLLTAAALACRRPLIVAPAMNGGDVRAPRHPGEPRPPARARCHACSSRAPARSRRWGSGGPAGCPSRPSCSRPSRPRCAPAATLDGLKVLVTAGGTREPIDAVRYVGNRSSGRMGFALAEEAARRGAEVTVVAANVALPRRSGIEYVDVQTAAELAAACEERFDAADVLLMAAAVADYRPDAEHAGKLKKDEAGGELALRLVRTPDVLATLAARRRPGQLLVGFAAEHGEGAIAYGREKLARKDLDAVVVNDIGAAGIGFDTAQNEVTIVTPDSERHVPRASKAEVATAILDAVLSRRSSSDMKVPR